VPAPRDGGKEEPTTLAAVIRGAAGSPATARKQRRSGRRGQRRRSLPLLPRALVVAAANLTALCHDGSVHRVVIVGGGFGGLRAARALRRAPVEITLVDRRNFHLFQPLLYQVATGSLSPDEIATPLRGVLRRQANARVLLGQVTDVDLAARTVHIGSVDAGGETDIPYDTLVVATGARHAYFGRDEWAAHAPGLKSIEDALDIRRHILSAFEAAELERDPAAREAWLTFVVVGAGPTGVEVAGQIAELARDTLRGNFRAMDPGETRVILVEAADRVLLAFPPKLSERAADALGQLGVTVRRECRVMGIEPDAVCVQDAGQTQAVRIATQTVIWAAGVQASSLTARLADAAGAPTDRTGRILVNRDLTVPDHPEVFAIGDMACLVDAHGRQLPGTAPVAIQQGEHVARTVRARVAAHPPTGAFRYRDKGSLATIGRAKAVAQIGRLQLWGLPAWVMWLLVHLLYLVGFQNRVLVLMRWSFSFLTRGRGARVITGA
jgi:NADH dehydrogenase